MATKRPVTIPRFLGLMTLLTIATAQSPFYMGDDCQNSSTTEQQALTQTYQTNLQNTLTWLYNDADTGKGYNHHTTGNGTSDVVYGLYDCRGDLTGQFCEFCVSTAASEILQRCQNKTSAVIWYNYCVLRYSNKNFYGNLTITPSWEIVGSKNITAQDELQKVEENMHSLIREATVETNKLYAMGEFNLSDGGVKRYGLVQCTRDLTSNECSQCLEAMLDKVPQCCGGKIGWQVLAPSCIIKYDDYMFYDDNQTSSPLPNSPGTYNNLFISCIITSLLSYYFGFVVPFCTCTTTQVCQIAI